MIAKLVCHGPDRAGALAALNAALQQLQASGWAGLERFTRRHGWWG